ncbi:TrbC/VirB2 family protein [Gilliamella sp. B2717]|uniref:TrbC/VirB2 family protein n=1 Tax=Gilliamella sp. B2717 TaxID=2817996 RepID=UPI00226A4D67|nr:TrbC/VirB2 family protein [Gilliamella sp. B2717]MCX8579562.1 TrbC/VirB2 family protein [Gilliamella sp. B2717]
MKLIKNLFWLSIGILITNPSFAAGLSKTTGGMKDLQTSIHAIVGVVFLITGLLVGVIVWRGTKTWEECSKWVIGVAFAGGAAELIGIFF